MSDEYIKRWAKRLEGLKIVGFSFSEIEEKLRKKIKRHLREACENIKIEVAKEYEKDGTPSTLQFIVDCDGVEILIFADMKPIKFVINRVDKKELSREAEVLLEVLENIDKKGYFDTNVPWEWIEWEEVEFKDDEDLIKFINEEVPEAIKDVAKEIGASAHVYHKRDDVQGSEYIVQISWREKQYTLYVDYDPYDIEEGRFALFIAEGEKGLYEPSVHYRSVY
jgi:hypothetical protein